MELSKITQVCQEHEDYKTLEVFGVKQDEPMCGKDWNALFPLFIAFKLNSDYKNMQILFSSQECVEYLSKSQHKVFNAVLSMDCNDFQQKEKKETLVATLVAKGFSFLAPCHWIGDPFEQLNWAQKSRLTSVMAMCNGAYAASMTKYERGLIAAFSRSYEDMQRNFMSVNLPPKEELERVVKMTLTDKQKKLDFVQSAYSSQTAKGGHKRERAQVIGEAQECLKKLCALLEELK